MKKCVIFDMDGVIIDSEPIHMKCEKKIFELLGITVSIKEHNKLVGSTDETMWAHIEKSHELPITVSEIINLKKTLYMDYLKQEVYIRPVQYVSELIFNLHRNNFLLVLASSSSHVQINYILNSFGLKSYFHAIISGEDVKNGKPHPDIFLKASESVGVSPENCVVIEDSYNGVTAAKNANMKCIGYLNPNSGNQDLSKADLTVSSFNEVSVVSIKGLL